MDYRELSEEKIHERAVWVYGLAREVAPDLPLKQDAVISDTMLCTGDDLYQEDYERLAEFIRAVHEGRYRNVPRDLIRAMMDYVDAHQPCSYAQLLSHSNDEQPDWFQCLMFPDLRVVMKDYCRAARDAKV